MVVALDPTLTPELRTEGLARELVSRVQRLRKEAGLAVSDRIRLHASGDAEVDEAVREHRDWIASEVLAREVVIGGGPSERYDAAQTLDLDGLAARVALTKER